MKCKPLYDILKNTNRKILWTNELVSIFNDIENLWSKCLENYMPNDKDDFVLETDASQIGIGGILKQADKSIAYISRVLKGSEINYSISERELLAAIWCMEKFEYYLIGKKFTLVTDHRALVEIHNRKEFCSSKMQRWIERLSRFDFNVVF
ncbi:Retrovirus-related Pol polyprotein from transposon [Dictyocoela muelleri]|nr:Retrovirus-related Pol polyprotein from transposon [Dictyocoela muelleri]